MGSYQIQDEEPLRAFDWTESTTPSFAVIEAVSEVSGDDPAAIEPLYDVVDPDSLDGVFASAESSCALRVAFEYHGYRVVVAADGRGFVHERTGPSPRRGGDAMEEYR